MTIKHLLQKGTGDNYSYDVITYIYFVGVFDSILHTYTHDSGITRVWCFKEVLLIGCKDISNCCGASQNNRNQW